MTCLFYSSHRRSFFFFFFFNDTATTEIYTLSLHDALPIYETEQPLRLARVVHVVGERPELADEQDAEDQAHDVERDREDRKSTRLNSSHSQISYAVFCLKKKKKKYSRRLARHHETESIQNP